MLALQQITKSYTNKNAETTLVLDNISFEINDEIICVIGPNGCGKSTLLKIIAKLESPTSGQLRSGTNSTRSAKQPGLIFQNHLNSLLPWKTVLRNVEFPLLTKMSNLYERQLRVKQTLAKLNLTNHQHKYPYELSGGLSQLTAFARALVTDPNILLLDEPFSALDYHTSIQLQKQFLKIWEELRIPTVIVTHSLEEALLLADKIIILSKMPAKIIKVIKNQLPRPRTIAQLGHADFHELKKSIIAHLDGFIV